MQICFNNTYWGVCDNKWSTLDAQVICRTLHGSNGIPRKAGYFSTAENLDILLDDIACHGNESSVLDCEHNPLGEHNCQQSEYAGVTCMGMLLFVLAVQ